MSSSSYPLKIRKQNFSIMPPADSCGEKDKNYEEIQKADGLNNINDDVMREIMCRASISWREISVTRCVSMKFANLIKSPDFMLRLRKKFKNNEPDLLAGIFYHVKNPKFYRTIFRMKFIPVSKWSDRLNDCNLGELKNRGLNALENMRFLPPELHLEDCRRGLILCSRLIYRVSQDAVETNGYFVCNPITRQHSWLPMPPTHSSRKYSRSRTAFVVDEETAHYQVLKLPPTYYSDNVDVEVYSSLLRCWMTRKYRLIVPGGALTSSSAVASPYHCPTVQVGHSLYWIDKHFDGKTVGERVKIVCCDIEKETIEFINHPVYNKNRWIIDTLCIGESCGNLVCASLCEDRQAILLWRLEQGHWVDIDQIATRWTENILALDQQKIYLEGSGKISCFNTLRRVMLRPAKKAVIMSLDKGILYGDRAVVVPYLLPKMPLPVF